MAAHMDGGGYVYVINDGDLYLITLGGNDFWTGRLAIHQVHWTVIT